MTNTIAGLNLTALIEQAVGPDFRTQLGNSDGYRITILQDGHPLAWLNLASLDRLAIQVTGWRDDVGVGNLTD